ncbi:H-NS histone family protein [Pseudolabrys taiwanensis]|uniref:H-NS histone family protein n=2 Tax=Pseudolabrys taiwanensis TaxID=331696 RepID=A0A345ZSZ7_9HYPH|nr:H-NS histone family protein [Pseudolabrys taiwanensis]
MTSTDVRQRSFGPPMPSINLKTLSFDELLELRDQVDAAISKQIESERRALEMKLERLNRFSDRPAKAGDAVSPMARSPKFGKVPPQFRNPDNPEETWSGRGLRPRWMVAALAAGRTIEDLMIREDGAVSEVRKAISRRGTMRRKK